MTSPTLDTSGLDTWLARLLHARGAVKLPTLQVTLRAVRSGRGPTLARSLVAQGLLDEASALALLAEAAAGVSPAVHGGAAAAVAAPQAGRAGSTPSPASRRLGDYELLDRLGQGGMGAVWRARHVQTGAVYALKTQLPGADPELAARFAREGAAQAAVDAHPNVVRVRSAGSAAGTAYLVMDLAPGGSLAERLAGGPLPPEEAARVCAGLAEGLAHCHAQGVLHRDLKPDNVLFDAVGTPMLVDFGLATRVGDERLTATGAVLGTPGYMAPEQAQGKRAEVDERTDVYGLGALLYHCLTGVAPFGREGSLIATLHAVSATAPARPRDLTPTVPPRLEAICLQALAKERSRRQPSATALASQLAAFLAGEPVPRDRRRTAALVGGAVASAGLLALVLASRPGASTPSGPADPHTPPAHEPAAAVSVPVAFDEALAALNEAAFDDRPQATGAAVSALTDALARAPQALGDPTPWRDLAAVLAGGGSGAPPALLELERERREVAAWVGLSAIEAWESAADRPAAEGGARISANAVAAAEARGRAAEALVREAHDVLAHRGAAADVLRLRIVVTVARLVLDIRAEATKSADRERLPSLVAALDRLAHTQQGRLVAALVAELQDDALLEGRGQRYRGDPELLARARSLPAPFGALAELLETTSRLGDQLFEPPPLEPAQAGRFGSALLGRLHLSLAQASWRALRDQLLTGDLTENVGLWRASQRHGEAAVAYAVHATGRRGRWTSSLEVAPALLAAGEVSRARALLPSDPYPAARTDDRLLKWGLLQAEIELAEGRWRAAEERLAALCEETFQGDLQPDRWTALAWAQAARGAPRATAHETLRKAAAPGVRAKPWLPWRSVAAAGNLLESGQDLRVRLRRALAAAGALKATPGERWLWEVGEPRETGKLKEYAALGVVQPGWFPPEALAALGRDLMSGDDGAPPDAPLARDLLVRAALGDGSSDPEGVNHGRNRLAWLLASGADPDVTAGRRWLERVLASNAARRFKARAAATLADICGDPAEVLELAATWAPDAWEGRRTVVEALRALNRPEEAMTRLGRYASAGDDDATVAWLDGLFHGLDRVPPAPEQGLSELRRFVPKVAAIRDRGEREALAGKLRAVVGGLAPDLRARAEPLLAPLGDG